MKREAKKPDCIMPAGGLSSRMGSWKPLLPYGESTLVETSVSRALETCGRIILVTGYRGDELEALFSGRSEVECIRNEKFARGIFSSIQAGAAVVEAPLFFVAHADMPELPAELYRLLLDAMDGETDMLRPVCRGKPGHPVLCRRRVASTILAEAPESNMQNVMRHHRLREIAVEWQGCVYDVDRPEDLKGRLHG